jgi:phospholipase C
MDSRRDFLKMASLLAGGMVVDSASGAMRWAPDSIKRALAIDPVHGSTFLDAEHVVILMQENRSFDHTYGCLQGVRGYRDPHPLELPNGNPVWLQSDERGKTFAPFRLNMWESSATWMDSLPHGWNNQTDARNKGRYDKWLPNKHSSTVAYYDMPLTMGYYNREDIPFYYALADAFTVCDGNHCSSLTGTNPNRLHLWTGTIRAEQDASSMACVSNDDVGYPIWQRWTTFPERLEQHGVSWKIYQNEVDLDSGFSDDEGNWLGNFQDNPAEWFEQFNLPFRHTRRSHVSALLKTLPGEIEVLKAKLPNSEGLSKTTVQKQIDEKVALLSLLQTESSKYTDESWESLNDHQKSLHRRAFVTNDDDPNYRVLTDLVYQDGEHQRTVQVPAGDVFYQFRKDATSGELPTVSWLVAPEAFSDHPSSAWYGAWYVSEALDILTKNPEVWKKTIFILCYDENDGYFDHLPPFVAPNPKDPTTGKTSGDIDTRVDFVELSECRKHDSPDEARESSIGLGYRVPLVIVSPWSRGGVVNSETFDHTSILQFLEIFTSHKSGKQIRETNISQWRRHVCGDLTSVFRPYHGETVELPKFVERDPFVEDIHKSKFKKLPDNFRDLNEAEIMQIKMDSRQSEWMPKQEPGTRTACPLKYELYADGKAAGGNFEFTLSAGDKVFGASALSSGFSVYAHTGKDVLCRSYAVAAGTRLEDSFPLSLFDGGNYRIRIDGPNGFYREFRGSEPPILSTTLKYSARGDKLNGNLKVNLHNEAGAPLTIGVMDNAYGATYPAVSIGRGDVKEFQIDTSKSHGWYDFSVSIDGHPGFVKRYAGHVETGQWSITDPAMA